MTCLSCIPAFDGGQQEPRAAESPSDRLGEVSAINPVDPGAIDGGTPGASARQEFARRQARREANLEAKWGTGRLGRLAKLLSDDPHSTKSWATGAAGEERVAEVLHERLGDNAVLLHDRKVPGTRGNIDHLVIASSGVWIIDAKRYSGKVEKRDVGRLFRTDMRLYVDGRDRTKTVDGLTWQLKAVRRVIDEAHVPVHPALCFVGADWPLFARPFQLNGVWISWPKKLAELIVADGPVQIDHVERTGGLLAAAFPAHR